MNYKKSWCRHTKKFEIKNLKNGSETFYQEIKLMVCCVRLLKVQIQKSAKEKQITRKTGSINGKTVKNFHLISLVSF